MSIIASVFCAAMPDYVSLIFSRIIVGMTVAVSVTPLSVYLSEFSPNKSFYSLATVLSSVGFAIGGGWCGILGYLFLERVGWRWFVLLTSTPLFVLPIILFQFILPESKKHHGLEKDEELEGGRKSTTRTAMLTRIIKISLLNTFRIIPYSGSILLLPALIKEDNIRNDRNSPCKAIHGAQFLTVSLLFGICHLMGKGLGYCLHKAQFPVFVSFMIFSTLNLVAMVAMQFTDSSLYLLVSFLSIVQITLSAMSLEVDILSYDKFFFTKSYLPISSAFRVSVEFIISIAANAMPEIWHSDVVLKIHLVVSIANNFATFSKLTSKTSYYIDVNARE